MERDMDYKKYLEDVAARYTDYQLVDKKEIQFRNPNEKERKLVKKVKSGQICIFVLVILLFALLTVLPFFCKSVTVRPSGYVTMGILTLIVLYFLFKELHHNTAVITGKVIAGYYHVNPTSRYKSNKTPGTYYVSAVVDENRKLMIRDIEVSKDIFIRLKEKDEILILSTGTGLRGIIME